MTKDRKRFTGTKDKPLTDLVADAVAGIAAQTVEGQSGTVYINTPEGIKPAEQVGIAKEHPEKKPAFKVHTYLDYEAAFNLLLEGMFLLAEDLDEISAKDADIQEDIREAMTTTLEGTMDRLKDFVLVELD